MNKILLLGAVAVIGTSMVSCDDFLDDNRYPKTSIINTPEYWSTASNVEMQCDKLYGNFSGYGNGNAYGTFYFSTLTDDQAGGSFTDWKFTNVLSSSAYWDDPYTEIRRCSYIIEGVRSSSLADHEKEHYEGIAKLNRAYQYYQLVRRYGDVPWIGQVLLPQDEDIIYSARTNRDIVMDSVLNDLDYAYATIETQDGKTVWSKDLALAIKSEVCLYEGTFCRYRTAAENGAAPDETRAKKYLEECVKASTPLLSAYPVGDDYACLYNSTLNGSGSDVKSLLSNAEVIFMKAYSETALRHSLIAYTTSSTQISGLSKDLFDSYLFKDGKPLALTTLDKNDAGVIADPVADKDKKPVAQNFDISDVIDVRDARLAMTTDPVIYFQGQTYVRAGSMAMTSSTGYGVRKYDNVFLSSDVRTSTSTNYTCAPLFWGARVALNYAEAKAELGTLSDSDMDATLNKLYARAELPTQTVASLSNMNDPANNMGVSSLIWEVRRCRRCELVMDDDIRYWDLIRWHKLDLLDSSKHPNILLGANISNYADYVTKYNAIVDAYNKTVKEEEKIEKIAVPSNVNGYIDGSKGKTRIFSAKHYLFPIPSEQIALNPALEQNPLWK